MDRNYPNARFERYAEVRRSVVGRTAGTGGERAYADRLRNARFLTDSARSLVV
jgi:hypothetical protein